MKQFFFTILAMLLLASCSQNKTPDVSDIKVDLHLLRFEHDLFGIDTSNLDTSIESLKKKYPNFTVDYLANILGLNADSIAAGNPQSIAFKQFLKDYAPIKDSSDKIYKDFSKWFEEVREGLKYVRFYFPDYHLPKKIITFIGPMDAFFQTSFGIQGDVLTSDGLGIALQLHLGKNFSFYNSEIGQTLYPEYISRNFDAAHIPRNCMRNIVDDLFPSKTKFNTLIGQMVERGKRLYLLTRFLPKEKESVLLGYTDDQMKGVLKNEAVIWDFFLSNDLLNNSDQNLIKNYVGESPVTQEFGQNAPGDLGSFTGLQIVKKYMQKFPETTLTELMNVNPRNVFERSKYKPKS